MTRVSRRSEASASEFCLKNTCSEKEQDGEDRNLLLKHYIVSSNIVRCNTYYYAYSTTFY